MRGSEQGLARADEGQRRVPDAAVELVCERLRIVAQPTRVRIVRHLEQHGPASVQDVCDGLGASHQNVSKHLRVLHRAGLVGRSLRGSYAYYELVDWTALWVIEKTAAALRAQFEEQQERFSQT